MVVNKRYLTGFAIAIAALIILTIINIMIGSSYIPLKDIISIIFKGDARDSFYTVIMDIRLPRIIAAIILGGALSVSGLLLQTFFANPIAGPYVLGISSGAKLTVAIVMIFFLQWGINITSFAMVLAAFIGSLLAMGFVLILSFKVKNMSMLVVCGIMIGYICSAVTDFLVTFANDSNIVNLHNWSMGSLSGMDWQDIRIMMLIVIISIVLVFALSKPIGAFLLGETYAGNMGVNVGALKVLIILLSSLLSATVTAFAGPVSFVGIAVPHLMRSLFKTSKPVILIPGSFLGGAVVMLFCDGIARTIFAPTEVSISSVTAIFLVPVVIYMMIRRNKDY